MTGSLADWSRPKALYEQCLESVKDEDNPYLPRELAAFLAELVSRMSVTYYGQLDRFVREAHSAFDATRPLGELYADRRFEVAAEYQSKGGPGFRRRPAPFEAIVETARRLRDLGLVLGVLADHTIGVVLGGSASYGRFFNVMGAREKQASDLDLYVVVPDPEAIVSILSALESVPAIDKDDLNSARARFDEFTAYLGESSVPTVFSFKVGMWLDQHDPMLEGIDVSGDYAISMHVVTTQVSDEILMVKHARLDLDALGKESILHDFRATDPGRTDHQRSFGGRNVRFEMDSVAFGSSVVRPSRAFFIGGDDSYYPGMFQNLVLPAFDVRSGGEGFKQVVQSFRWKLVERLRYERRIRPDDYLRLSLSHTRAHVFAPHVVRAVDASTHLS